MDFLEGVFLGANYSDTLYQEQKISWHRLVVAFAFYLFFTIFLRVSSRTLMFALLFLIPVYIFQSLLSPFISRKYYSYGLGIRFFILFFQFIKKSIFLVIFICLLLQLNPFFLALDSRLLLEQTSQLFSNFFAMLTSNFHILGLILVGISFVSLIFFSFVLFIFFLYALPNLWLHFGNLWQRLFDKIFKNKIDY